MATAYAATIPGQVPTKERIKDLALVPSRGTPEVVRGVPAAKPFSAAMLLDHTEPRMSTGSILDGLGLDPARTNSWKKFLDQALHQTNAIDVRRDINTRMLLERMEPALRKAIFQRSMVYYRDVVQKSLIQVYTPDQLRKADMTRDEFQKLTHKQQVMVFYAMTPDEREGLQKAEARGGKYHRRVKSGKGYRYFYDADKYHEREDAHISGPDAQASYIKKTVQKKIESAGEDGCGVDQMKDLVQKYGSKAVGKCMNEMKASGGFAYKAGKLYLNKSERFTLRR